jgi:hypothetical protein
VFTPASLVLVVLGPWMVVTSQAWDFGRLWVEAAIAMFAYSFVSGAFYLGPSLGRLNRLYAERGDGRA